MWCFINPVQVEPVGQVGVAGEVEKLFGLKGAGAIIAEEVEAQKKSLIS